MSDISGGLSTPLQDSDRFGISVAGTASFDGVGGSGLLVGAILDDDGAVYLLEIEGSALSCRNGVLDPVEECDDGSTTDFDGCTAVCEVEDDLKIFGIAETAGLLSVELDGVTVNLGVSSGDTPPVLASLLATVVNATPALGALGTNARSVESVVYSNGTFASGAFIGDGVSSSINPGRVLGSQKNSNTQGSFTGILNCLLSLFIRRSQTRLAVVRIERIRPHPATRSDDGVRRHEASLRLERWSVLGGSAIR